MPQLPSLANILADARISALVAVPTPALLFDAKGKLLFSNPAGLKLIGARTLPDATARDATEIGPLAQTAARLGPHLPAAGSPRLERLRLPGENFLQPNTFAFSRIVLADNEKAVLAVGLDVGKEKSPTLVEAINALFEHSRDAFALFDLDGNLIETNIIAATVIGPAQTFQELEPNAEAAFASVRDQGNAEIDFGPLRIVLLRVGTKAQSAILALFADREEPVESEPLEPTETERRAEELTAIAGQETAPITRKPEEKRVGVDHVPTRFVWQVGPEGRFSSISPELADVIGVRDAEILGLDWAEAASRFSIANAGEVMAAITRRDTWSGITIYWPVAGSEKAVPIDLAALPVFDRERRFQGYRGFGVFREMVARPEKTITEIPPTSLQTSHSVPVVEEQPENVVRLRTTVPANSARHPVLTAKEHDTFREIARTIGERIDDLNSGKTDTSQKIVAETKSTNVDTTAAVIGERALLDRLPLGIVVHRADRVLYANRTALEWIGLPDVKALDDEGGLHRFFNGTNSFNEEGQTEKSRKLAVTGRNGELVPVEAKLLSVPWEGETALVYILTLSGSAQKKRNEANEMKLRVLQAANEELRGILDTATDGILLLDHNGRILNLNRSAEALFGYDSQEIEGQSFVQLFAPESHKAVVDYLEGLAANGVVSLLNDGREIIGQEREGGLIPLFMTLGKIGENPKRFCAVFRDITQWKRAEEELLEAKRKAEHSSSAKSDFLAKISHEIRTPLNAIIGFADVMREERFGPIGNERYREYLKDIQTSGSHLISLINDLLDLSKIEAGKVDLSFAGVDLNDIARQCMAIMQSQANRERIIIRTSLFPELPQVVADVRSIRQIVLNLLSNSIKFTPPGGQVILSTQLSETGEVLLRVRDTGIGMSEADVAIALEPFRQLSTTGRGTGGGSGLGLPLTKALAEANRASFSVKSNVNAGTLIEISFPANRVLVG
jgi:PAS domain S-box-containing protein